MRTFRIVNSPWPERGKHFDRNALVWEHEQRGDGLIGFDELRALEDIIIKPGGFTSNRPDEITIPSRLFERMVWSMRDHKAGPPTRFEIERLKIVGAIGKTERGIAYNYAIDDVLSLLPK